MGSEGEIRDSNSRIYIAVGRDVKEGKSLLNWAVKSFEWSNKCLSLLHVHQLTNLVTLESKLADFTFSFPCVSVNGKPSASKIKNQLVKACLESKDAKNYESVPCLPIPVPDWDTAADQVYTETSNIEEGILQLIIQHRVRWLIMGAKAETFSPKLQEIVTCNFSKAMVIYHEAPPSCHIWFICKESLIYARHVDSGSNSTTTRGFSSSEDNSGATITLDIKVNMDVNTDSGDVSSLLLKVKSPENLPRSSSDKSLDHESEEEETSDLGSKLECVTTDAENSKPTAFDVDQSLKRWGAEIDALKAVFKAEALYEEERRQK